MEVNLNKRIRKLQTKDMLKRKIRELSNEDRLYDLLKCSEMKGHAQKRMRTSDIMKLHDSMEQGNERRDKERVNKIINQSN